MTVVLVDDFAFLGPQGVLQVGKLKVLHSLYMYFIAFKNYEKNHPGNVVSDYTSFVWSLKSNVYVIVQVNLITVHLMQ
jgi:hypothetical protein